VCVCVYVSPSVPRAETPSDFIKFYTVELYCAVCVCVCVCVYIYMASGRGRRRKQLVDDLTETRGYGKLKWAGIAQSV
jgi:hypothetical protein